MGAQLAQTSAQDFFRARETVRRPALPQFKFLLARSRIHSRASGLSHLRGLRRAVSKVTHGSPQLERQIQGPLCRGGATGENISPSFESEGSDSDQSHFAVKPGG